MMNLITLQVMNSLINSLNAISPTDVSQPLSIRQTALAYKTCQASVFNGAANIKSLANLTQRLGGWPMITHGWNPSRFRVDQTVGYLEGLQGVMTFLISYVLPDWRKSTSHALYLDQGTVYLGSPKYYSEANPYMQNQVRLQQYQYLIFNVAYTFAQQMGITGLSNSSIMQQAQDVVQFETKLAALLTPPGLRRNFTQMYNKMTLLELQTQYQGFNWELYFATMTPGNRHASLPFKAPSCEYTYRTT